MCTHGGPWRTNDPTGLLHTRIGRLMAGIHNGRTVRRAFWYVLYLMTVGLAAVYLSASIILLAWALAGPVWSLS